MHQLLRTPFWIVREAIHEFLTNGKGGKIIFMLPSESDMANDIRYVSAQTAIEAFSRSISKEYGTRNIYSNVVIPNGPLSSDAILESVIQTGLFLASDYSSLIDGDNLHVGHTW